MAELTNEQKKAWAKTLYTRETLTQAEIAERVGVSRVTVNNWIGKGNWEQLKASITITREEQLKNLYRQLAELNNAIMGKPEGERFPNAAEADTISKLSNAIKKLEETGVPVMKEGLVRGVTGIMLYEGTFSKKDIICILCPANPQLPDPRAAATALTPLSKIVPNLNIDPTPLNNEANDIDNRVRAQQQAQQEIGTQNIYG